MHPSRLAWRLLPIVILSCAPATRSWGAEAKPLSAERLGRAVDAYAAPLIARGHLSGQLLVARHGKVLFERSWGWANLELRSPMTPETRMNVASITKPMTVVLAYRLMDQRKIAYRDSIARWLPDFPKAESIRVEHLLRHRSGIPHELEPDSLATQPRTAADMVAIAARRGLEFSPGSQSTYSTGGFSVLARILEIASGQDYQALLQEHLFGPLEMTHSLHTDARVLMPRRAACYVPVSGGLENAAFQDLSGLVGGGSVWSTARDLHRFVQAVVTGRLGDTAKQSWLRNGRLLFNGQTSGFRAFATYDSASGLEVVYAGNVASGAPGLIQQAVPRLAAGETVSAPELPRLATALPPAAEIARLRGVYRLGNGTRLRIHVRNGKLWTNDWPLEPIEGGGFFSPRDYGIVRPVAGSDGRIERLDWEQAGQTYPAPRVADLD
jgi:CubicO group peptidase (beta-lactamase class C family)